MISQPLGTSDDRIGMLGEVIHTHPIDTERVLWILRFRLLPGAETPFWSHPDMTVMYVESGLLAFTAVTGTVMLAVEDENGTSQKVRAVTGVEYQLKPTHFASFGVGVQHSVWNPVTLPTVFVVTMITPTGTRPYDGLWTSEGYHIEVRD